LLAATKAPINVLFIVSKLLSTAKFDFHSPNCWANEPHHENKRNHRAPRTWRAQISSTSTSNRQRRAPKHAREEPQHHQGWEIRGKATSHNKERINGRADEKDEAAPAGFRDGG